MRWCIQSDEESVLFGAERGCAEFEQRLLRFDAPGGDQGPSADDEVLYVLRGRGTATIGGEPARLAAGTPAYVAAGSSRRVGGAGRPELPSVLVRDPLPADGARHAVVRGGQGEAGAGAGRPVVPLPRAV